MKIKQQRSLLGLMRLSMAAGLMGILTLSACTKDDKLNDTDRNFMVQAAYSNLAEIDAGQLASTKGQKDSVRMYGAMMVTDHTKANNELTALANSKGVTLPTAPDPEHQALKMKLMTLTERAFDMEYINAQVNDHVKTIALFESEVASGKDAEVKAFANQKLPDLRMHLTMAQSIKKSL